MANVYGLLDQLDRSVNRLGVIQTQVTGRAFAPPTRIASYAPRRAAFGSPNDWWETLKQWVTVGIPSWIGPLSDLYRQLVEAGVITPAQAEKGLTKEELIALIKEIMEEEKKPWYQSPWLPVAIGVGVVGGAGAYYVVKKKRR